MAGVLAGLAAGCGKANPFTPENDNIKPSGEKVKLLSVDGEIIEVDKAFLKPAYDEKNDFKCSSTGGHCWKEFCYGN